MSKPYLKKDKLKDWLNMMISQIDAAQVIQGECYWKPIKDGKQWVLDVTMIEDFEVGEPPG